jgi:hypothetical protein
MIHLRKEHTHTTEKAMQMLQKKLNKIETQYHYLLHYWKVRCKERGALKASYQLLETRYNNMRQNEKILTKMIHRSKLIMGLRNSTRGYLVYLSSKEAHKLHQFLRYYTHGSFVQHKANTVVPHLDKNELAKLKGLLRKDWRKYA